jgi:D-alanyl-D-alanine carboxypeptidase (penicillin-binding protein 5/6)
MSRPEQRRRDRRPSRILSGTLSLTLTVTLAAPVSGAAAAPAPAAPASSAVATAAPPAAISASAAASPAALALGAGTAAQDQGGQSAPGPVTPPRLDARAALLVDETTGQVLYERNPRQPLPMASTTKVMTALLTLERLPQRRAVTIGHEPTTVGDDTIGLRAGERLTVHDLLLALLVKSANDAAVALADAVDGSEAAFVRRMNRRAAALGLSDTHYVTPYGLDRPGHHSSARDLARLWEVAMRRADFRALVATSKARIAGGGPLRSFTTTDKLLGHYRWLVGGKTGFTNQAGRCLVASASRGGRRLAAVVLGAPDAFVAARALFEYGFDQFVWVQLARRGQAVPVSLAGGGTTAAQPYQAAADVDALVRRDLLGQVRIDPASRGPAASAGSPGAATPAASTGQAATAAGPGTTVRLWLSAGGIPLVPLPLSVPSVPATTAAAPPAGGAGATFTPGPVPAGAAPAIADPRLLRPAP